MIFCKYEDNHEYIMIQCVVRMDFMKITNQLFLMPCMELTISQTSPGFYVSAIQVFWKH